MDGKGRRDKGANGERELAGILRDKYGFQDVKRGQVFNHQSDLIGLAGIHPEVKRVEKLNVEKAIKQAECEAAIRNDGIPVVFYRKNRKPWKTAMMMMDLMELIGMKCERSIAETIVQMSLDDWVRVYAEWRRNAN